MHLIRVDQFREGGSWFDNTIARSNAPFGSIVNWSRPFDVLLLVGAWLLTPMLGFKAALFWWGAFVGPVLLTVTALTLAWAVAPIFDPNRRILTAVLVIALPGVMSIAHPGSADHHVLVLLAFVVSLGLGMRLLQRPYSRHLALAAGATAGFGLWISVEFLASLAFLFVAMTCHWLVAGGDGARKNRSFALGLFLMIAVAMAAERPPADYFVVEYDRVSVVHLTVALLALSFWSVAGLVAGFTRGSMAPYGRLALAALGAVVAPIAMWIVYPHFFAGPLAEVDPVLLARWNQFPDAGWKPLMPPDLDALASLSWFLFYLGRALIVVPFLCWFLARRRNDPSWPALIVVGAAILVFLPLSMAHYRFTPFIEIVLIIGVVEVLGRVMGRLKAMSESLRGQIIRALITVGLVIGPPASSIPVFALSHALSSPPATETKADTDTRPLPRRPGCPLIEFADFLNGNSPYRGRPHTFLVPINFSAQLLYRTHHRVVATGHDLRGKGMRDQYAIFDSTEDGKAYDLIRERGIDLIVVCPKGFTEEFYGSKIKGKRSLHNRLIMGQYPPWLRPVELPPPLEAFLLYEVVK